MDRPTLFVDSAAQLPRVEGFVLPPRLAAMARTPAWLRDETHGRAVGCFAEGDEVPLMEAALQARAAPLFRDQTPITTYRDALERRWAALLDAGKLAPGALVYETHDGGPRYRPDGFPSSARLPGHRPRGPVPTGSWLVCTCARGVECHTAWLAPFVARAGWRVVLRGVEVPS